MVFTPKWTNYEYTGLWSLEQNHKEKTLKYSSFLRKKKIFAKVKHKLKDSWVYILHGQQLFSKREKTNKSIGIDETGNKYRGCQ